MSLRIRRLVRSICSSRGRNSICFIGRLQKHQQQVACNTVRVVSASICGGRSRLVHRVCWLKPFWLKFRSMIWNPWVQGSFAFAAQRKVARVVIAFYKISSVVDGPL